MDILTKLSVVLMLCGIDHAKDMKSTISVQGNNASVEITQLQTNGNTTLEIYFSGYTSNLHFTNVMLYHPMKGQNENISINSNYTGRLQGIATNNGNFSFLLLKVTFKDSGNYTVKENSVEKGKARVFVARRILVAQLGKPITLSFILNETTMSSIKIDNPVTKFSHLIYNVTSGDCIDTDVVTGKNGKIDKCVLENGKFSFAIPEIVWLHKGVYFAWDDKGRHLDSIYVDIQGIFVTDMTTSDQEEDSGKWLLISALVIALVATCLVIIAVRKHRISRVRKTSTHNLTYRNRNQTIANNSCNGCQNLETAHFSEETKIVSTKKNSEALIDFKNKKVQAQVRLNDKNIYARGLDCAKLSMRTACKLQTDSELSSSEQIQSEDAHGHDYVHEYDELKTYCRTDCLSNLLDKKATETTAEPSFEYDYVVQHTFMTLRPPAPDPVVTKKNRQQAKIAKLLYSFTKVNKKSLSRVNPSALYAKFNKKRAKETHCTGFSAELRGLDFTNELSQSCSLKLENDFAKKTIDSPKWSQHGRRQKRSNAKCIDSHIFVYKPESSKLQDCKTRSVPQYLSFDYPRDDFDYTPSMERGHRRCRSFDDLYGHRMTKIKVPQSRTSSASTCMNDDCYDSL